MPRTPRRRAQRPREGDEQAEVDEGGQDPLEQRRDEEIALRRQALVVGHLMQAQ
ncbi:MAG: hypothetical protein ACE367_17960 [Acidimicrobiales bacterium]